jgi:hypothetical protein
MTSQAPVTERQPAFRTMPGYRRSMYPGICFLVLFSIVFARNWWVLSGTRPAHKESIRNVLRHQFGVTIPETFIIEREGSTRGGLEGDGEDFVVIAVEKAALESIRSQVPVGSTWTTGPVPAQILDECSDEIRRDLQSPDIEYLFSGNLADPLAPGMVFAVRPQSSQIYLCSWSY